MGARAVLRIAKGEATVSETLWFKRAPKTRARFGRRRRRQRHGRSALWRYVTAMVCGVLFGYWIAEPAGDQVRAIVGVPAVYRLCAGTSLRNCVIDGDTIRRGGLSIRLEDIDAPETFGPDCALEEALGRQATTRLVELLNAGPFEVVYTGGRDEDAYGRKLRIVVREGRSLGDTLVAEGLARYWDGARRSWCG